MYATVCTVIEYTATGGTGTLDAQWSSHGGECQCVCIMGI
jgi:hypothetical protein